MSPPPIQALRDLLRAYEAKHGKMVSGNTELAFAVFQAREAIAAHIEDIPEADQTARGQEIARFAALSSLL